MKKSVKIILSIVLTLFILMLAGAGVVAGLVIKEFSPMAKQSNEQIVTFKIPYGTSAYDITKELKNQNLIRNERIFYTLLLRPHYLRKLYRKIDFPENISFKCGIYQISNALNYGQIIDLLASGNNDPIKISIPEGLTITKVGHLLEIHDICKKDDFVLACNDKNVLKECGINADTAEGFLFPDTYYFDFGMDANLVVERLVNTFFAKISNIDNLKDKSFDEIYDTIILASIVEREYKLKEEAPLISSVFTNRLKINMGLQSCATVEYVITEIQGKPHPEKIYNSDLKIDNPYNTYIYRGLPPGPICNPGMTALDAAANPAKTNYYFFQVMDADAGRHVFTSTFKDHRQNHILLSK